MDDQREHNQVEPAETKGDDKAPQLPPERQQHQQLEQLLHYAKTHSREMVAYALLVLGLLLLFVYPYFGQALIGIVAAVYFGEELLSLFFEYESYEERLGFDRTIVLGGLLLAFFIAAPVIYLAAGFTIALKHLLISTGSEKK